MQYTYEQTWQQIEAPVVIRVCRIVASLDSLQISAQLGLVMTPLLNCTRLLQKVVGQERQGVSWRCLSKCKDVKLPVAVSILQSIRCRLLMSCN